MTYGQGFSPLTRGREAVENIKSGETVEEISSIFLGPEGVRA